MKQQHLLRVGKYNLDLSNLANVAKKSAPYYKELSKRTNKISESKLDEIINKLHDDYFSQFDCLHCANCCRGLGPRLTSRAIDRLAAHKRMKPGQFAEEFLTIDEDNDYVFKTMPCPLISADNTCQVYENHPKACREYPHTAQPAQRKIFQITIRNAAVCPVVYCILQDLNTMIP